MDSKSLEAKRWITMAEKLLETGDFDGTQTFANRARESNPIIAEQILSVTETLLTAQSNPRDWYGILQLMPLTQSMEVVASQYRKLTLLLNPGRNKLSFADQAFRFVSEAWNVLSNPSKKANYDNELRFLQPGQQQPQLQQQQSQPQAPPPPQETQTPQKETPTQGTQPPFIRKSPRNTDRDGNVPLEGGERSSLNNKPPEQNRSTEPIWRRQMSQIGLAGTSQVNQTGTGSSSQFNRVNPTRTGQINQTATTTPPRENSEATESNGPTFWTACPYCYVLYEYPQSYEDCTLRCQIKNCRRAFHAGAIPSPPLNGKDSHPSCWGVCPLGFSKGGNFPSWTPVSTMFACSNPNIKNAGEEVTAKRSAPRVYFDDDVYVDFSDSIGSSEDDDDDDDDDWQNERRKKAKNVKGKGSVGSNAKKQQSGREKKATNGEANVDCSVNSSGVSTVPEAVPIAESSRKRVATSGRKQMGRGARNLGKLDLNVEFSNEVEEPVPMRNEENHPGYGEEDNIEGNGFFEGLDEFLNSLPILSAVGDDKAKAT